MAKACEAVPIFSTPDEEEYKLRADVKYDKKVTSQYFLLKKNQLIENAFAQRLSMHSSKLARQCLFSQ